MDIWKWAEEYNWCSDYMDLYTGRIYGCQRYHQSIIDGNPLEGIPVYEDGELIGYVHKNKG